MEDKPQLTATHGFNKFSHHWVKRDGPVWLRLVKAGQASDPELEQKLQDRALERRKASDEQKTMRVAKPGGHPAPRSSRVKAVGVKLDAGLAQRVARRVVDSHRSEL